MHYETTCNDPCYYILQINISGGATGRILLLIVFSPAILESMISCWVVSFWCWHFAIRKSVCMHIRNCFFNMRLIYVVYVVFITAIFNMSRSYKPYTYFIAAFTLCTLVWAAFMGNSLSRIVISSKQSIYLSFTEHWTFVNVRTNI